MKRNLLGELLRPFAFRHLRAFLARNYLMLALLLLVFVLKPHLTPITQPSLWFHPPAAPLATAPYAPLPPNQFDLTDISLAFPAIDPQGRFVPLYADAPVGTLWGGSLAILDIETEAIVLHLGTASRIFRPVLFNSPRNEFVIGFESIRNYSPSLSFRTWKQMRGTGVIGVFDAESGRLEREYRIPGLKILSDISPSGAELAIGGEPLGGVNAFQFYELRLLSLDTGEITRSFIPGYEFAFAGNSSVLAFHNKHIVRHDLSSEISIGKAIDLRGATYIDYQPLFRRNPPDGYSLWITHRPPHEESFVTKLSVLSRSGDELKSQLESSQSSLHQWNYHGPGMWLASRGLLLGTREETDNVTKIKKVDWCVIDLTSGKEHILFSESTAQGKPSSNRRYIFANDDMFMMYNEGPPQFIPISQILKGREE